MDKTKFKYLSQGGITKRDALEYIAWLADNGDVPEAPQAFMFEHWIETPLPVVYLGHNHSIVELPFLDLQHKDAVYGISVDGVLFSKNDVCISNENGATWQDVQEYIRQQNLQLFGAANFGRPKIRVPFLNEMQKVLPLRMMFNATVNIFRDHKLSADNWGVMQYATASITGQDKCLYVVDVRTGQISKQTGTPRYYHVRPIVGGGVMTKSMPMSSDGKLNWDQFTEETYNHLF
ncbi:MAG: hypothetical protein J6Y91_00345 [Alphaproteobacteria bacterium]|nr:hypothetical protein [Alphaproteobacteria bacterium]